MREDGILPHGDIVFHMDQINYQRPSQAMSLYGMDVPSSGDETKFLNSHMAYDTLPNNLKMRITKLYARNTYDLENERRQLRRIAILGDVPY